MKILAYDTNVLALICHSLYKASNYSLRTLHRTACPEEFRAALFRVPVVLEQHLIST